MNHLTSETQGRILSSLQTVTRATEMSFLLDEIKSATYTQGADLKGLFGKLSYYSKELAEQIGGTDFGITREIIKETQDLIKHSDRLRVEMSYTPSKDFLSGLHEIFSTLGYQNFLLEFTIVPETGTGARFYHNGNFIDISMFDLIKEKMKEFNFNI